MTASQNGSGKLRPYTRSSPKLQVVVGGGRMAGSIIFLGFFLLFLFAVLLLPTGNRCLTR